MEVILHIFTVNYIFKIEIIKKGFKIQFQPRVYKKKKKPVDQKKNNPHKSSTNCTVPFFK